MDGGGTSSMGGIEWRGSYIRDRLRWGVIDCSWERGNRQKEDDAE